MMYNDSIGYATDFANREIRILVCGSRDFNKGAYTEAQVHAKLDAIRNSYLGQRYVTVIQGWGDGVDLAAAGWAETRCIPFFSFPAEWKKYSKLAGPFRNELMLTIGKPDIIVAFPGGNGTKDMKTRAERRGIEIIEIEFEPT